MAWNREVYLRDIRRGADPDEVCQEILMRALAGSRSLGLRIVPPSPVLSRMLLTLCAVGGRVAVDTRSGVAIYGVHARAAAVPDVLGGPLVGIALSDLPGGATR